MRKVHEARKVWRMSVSLSNSGTSLVWKVPRSRLSYSSGTSCRSLQLRQRNVENHTSFPSLAEGLKLKRQINVRRWKSTSVAFATKSSVSTFSQLTPYSTPASEFDPSSASASAASIKMEDRSRWPEIAADLPRVERERRERLYRKNSRDFPEEDRSETQQNAQNSHLAIDKSDTHLNSSRKTETPIIVNRPNLNSEGVETIDHPMEHFAGEETEELLQTYAAQKCTSMSLGGLLEFGRNVTDETLIESSMFLHAELPIRLAKRAVELSSLPQGLCSMSAIKEVRNAYIKSFKELLRARKPDTIESERKFTNLIKEIYERHSGVLWNISRGVHQLKTTHKHDAMARFSLPETFPGVQTFLDHFFLSRIGIRVLIGQHIALHEHIDGWVGLFCLETSPVEIAQSAARSATKACLRRYNLAPKVNVTAEPDLQTKTFPYIPAHLHHILFELLKNSMRATIERVRCVATKDEVTINGCKYGDDLILPPVEINITGNKLKQELIVEVIDHGDGFESDEVLRNAWSYMYTTASEKDCAEVFDELNKCRGRDFDANELGLPLAGLGYGLPISRMFAKYLGGNLEIEKCGDGARARLTLKAVEDSFEAIP